MHVRIHLKLFGVAATGLALAMTLSMPSALLAMGDPPAAPKINCEKKANKDKAECKKTQNQENLSDSDLYYKGYWLAKAGQYSEALSELRRIKKQDDPKVLNYIGFATRKLGNVDEALAYYGKALELNPNYTVARAYLGEAYLQKGQLGPAEAQLGEIEKRCGRTCKEYAELSGQIDSYKTTGKLKSEKMIEDVKS